MKTLKIIYILLIFCGAVSAQVETKDQRLDPDRILGKWIYIEPSDDIPSWSRSITWMHFLPNNKIEWSVRGTGSKPVIRRGSYTLMLSGIIFNHSTERVLLRIDPTPYDPAIGGVREDGTPIFLMNLDVGKGIDNRFPHEAYLLKFTNNIANFALTRDNSEQAAPSNRENPSK
jgi:hypothetical protein